MKAVTKLLIISVGGIAIFIALLFVFIKPTLRQVVSLHEDLRAKRAELKTLEQQILAYKTAQSDLSKVTQRDRVLQAIVETENIVFAIQDVENAATKSETTHTLTIDDYIAQGTKKSRAEVVSGKIGIVEVPYDLLTKNDYEGLIGFLQYLEHAPHFTEITAIRAIAETTQTSNNTIVQSGNIQTSVEGVFFVKKEPAKTDAKSTTNKTETDED